MQKRVGLGPTGEEMFAELVPLAVGIFLDEVKNSQRWDLGAVIKAAVMCAFVPKEDERGGVPKPEEGDRLTVTMEGEAAWTGQAVFVRNRQLGDVSHWEVFMSRV